jgi:5-methylcytosine-specific restriction protein A
MPTQPPRFGRQTTPRKAWALGDGQKDRRLRGRAGVALRGRVRAEEPCCRSCLADGKRVRTEEIDHIRPLSEGGTDERSNLQGLCKPCHDAKTKVEGRSR